MPAYSGKAQPYLDAIAESVFTSQDVRDWLVKDTPAEANYTGSSVLIDEQRDVRWRSKQTKQPFWANYWCGLDSRCTCRIEGSKGLESDAIFFFRNKSNRVLAVHVEFKHRNEPFGFGQPEAYPLRAACFAKTYHQRRTLNAHHDWTTVIFCGPEALADVRLRHFQRVITHDEAATIIAAYPTAQRPKQQSNAVVQTEKPRWKEKTWMAMKLAAVVYFIIRLVQGIAHNWPDVGSGTWQG
jgi:hypothetical protein